MRVAELPAAPEARAGKSMPSNRRTPRGVAQAACNSSSQPHVRQRETVSARPQSVAPWPACRSGSQSPRASAQETGSTTQGASYTQPATPSASHTRSSARRWAHGGVAWSSGHARASARRQVDGYHRHLSIAQKKVASAVLHRHQGRYNPEPQRDSVERSARCQLRGSSAPGA
jgi:hypothetical protein